MPADHPRDPAPARRPAARAERPARRDERPPARPEPGPAPIHEARELGFSDDPGREYWWDRLDPNARTQLLGRVGDVLDWWAYCHEGSYQPYVVVLGKRGFAITRPSSNDRGGPANRLLIWSLREASHREVRVSGRSGSAPTGIGGTGHTAGTDRTGGSAPAVVLPEPVRGFIGNLPVEAQQRLQQPFTTGDLVRESDYYYFGYPERFDAWCFLAGARTITFAAGAAQLLPGRRPEYAWELRCHQAEVAAGDR